jgi:hypothetical protein
MWIRDITHGIEEFINKAKTKYEVYPVTAIYFQYK